VPKEIIDSYTQEVLGEAYVSKIPGIMEGRHDFFRPEAVAVYELAPAAGEWIVLRDGRGASSGTPLFLSHPTKEAAQRVMAWLIANDASVRIAFYWMERKNFDPYFRLLNYIEEVALGNYPDPRQYRFSLRASDGDETGDSDGAGEGGADSGVRESAGPADGRKAQQ
jgi:hypothetical protein